MIGNSILAYQMRVMTVIHLAVALTPLITGPCGGAVALTLLITGPCGGAVALTPLITGPCGAGA